MIKCIQIKVKIVNGNLKWFVASWHIVHIIYKHAHQTRNFSVIKDVINDLNRSMEWNREPWTFTYIIALNQQKTTRKGIKTFLASKNEI